MFNRDSTDILEDQSQRPLSKVTSVHTATVIAWIGDLIKTHTHITKCDLWYKLQIEKDKGIEVSDEQILGIVAKEVKTRKDAIAEYEQANREDLIEKANEEIKALEEYLPKQLTDEELVTEVKKVIEKLNATSMKDMGPVMKEAKATIGAQADGKRINEVVKSLLA